MNVSFNVLDKYFFGASVGLYDVNYNRESFYQELGTDGITYDFSNWYNTDGSGIDFKLGFICRPIDDSPFRFGLNVSTPVWYRLEDVNGSMLYINDNYIDNQSTDPYQYNYRTPWKFGASLGYTVGNYFAVGAEYEYQDLSTAKYTENGHETAYMITQNKFIEDNLQGQSTLKLGMEVKPSSALRIQLCVVAIQEQRIPHHSIRQPIHRDRLHQLEGHQPLHRRIGLSLQRWICRRGIPILGTKGRLLCIRRSRPQANRDRKQPQPTHVYVRFPLLIHNHHKYTSGVHLHHEDTPRSLFCQTPLHLSDSSTFVRLLYKYSSP